MSSAGHTTVADKLFGETSVKLPQIQLTSYLQSNHPWIFERNIKHNLKLAPGTLVEIIDKQGKKAGTGFYNRFTPVAIRQLTGPGDVVNRKFILEKLTIAKNLRESWLPGQESYRLCHSEADGLSGLIIEKFATVIVLYPVSAGWIYMMDEVCDSLKQLYPTCKLKVVGNERHAAREKVSFDIIEERYFGPNSVVIEENGVKHHVDFNLGHKTGFFLDQRENRRLLAKVAKGKSLLDLCCNTGGFSLSAAHNGCEDITAVDLDEKAIAQAEKSARLNDAKVKFVHANAFNYMRDAIKDKKTWDVVVLDPAKLVGHKSEYHKGVGMYEDFNRLACQVVSPGGTLLTCSCSGLIDEKAFLDIVFRVATEVKREMKVVKLTGADADHPFTSTYPEGRYLKAAFIQVNKLS